MTSCLRNRKLHTHKKKIDGLVINVATSVWNVTLMYVFNCPELYPLFEDFFLHVEKPFFFFLNSPFFKYDADTWFEGEEALTYEI